MDNNAILERAGNLAAEKLKELKVPADKAKAEAESKVAAENKVIDSNKKDEGKNSQAELKAKEDERIINADDKSLSEPELSRKAELQETKKRKDESPEEKIKRVQESSQKRIDEIKSELLSERDKTKNEMASLRAELDELKRPKQQEDLKSKIKREQADIQAKYIEEDKSKPKDERREMSKEDLSDWYLEDPVEATKWIQKTEYRRARELEKLEAQAEKPKDLTEEKKNLAKEFIQKQNESRAKLISEFPGLIPSKDKIVEIRKKLELPLDRNLTKDEINKFNEEYSKHNEEFRLCAEIAKEKPEYLESTNGPELVLDEMKKRLNKSGKIEITEDEIQSRVNEEIERRKLIDGEGISSTKGGKIVKEDKKSKGSLSADQERVASKSKIGAENYEKMLKRRDSIAGAGSGGDKDE